MKMKNIVIDQLNNMVKTTDANKALEWMNDGHKVCLSPFDLFKITFFYHKPTKLIWIETWDSCHGPSRSGDNMYEYPVERFLEHYGEKDKWEFEIYE